MCRTAHGFVAADICSWVRKAILLAEDEAFENVDHFLEVDLRKEHLQTALKGVSPSALKELAIQVPTTKWTDIGG